MVNIRIVAKDMVSSTQKPASWRGYPREILDQALHALWAGVTTWLFLHWGYNGVFLGAISAALLVAREIEQYPPADDRPWDLLADCLGYLCGVLAVL